MEFYHPATVLIFSFILDLAIGDPVYRYHPVRIAGSWISVLQKKLKSKWPHDRSAGTILALTTIVLSVFTYSVLFLILDTFHPAAGFILNVYLVYSLIAIKDLFRHCRPVIDALQKKDVPGARKSIGLIVGRDVDFLDEAGIVRAALETLAENYVDGFLSPVFWYAAGCLAGRFMNISPVYFGVLFLIVFKVASTLDSMVGHKTEEFMEIGWAGARLDDLMNFIPARLSLFMLFSGAALTGLDSKEGLRTALRDRLKHESPNSAHPESFVAGAIRVRLGGPTMYRYGIKEKHWLGEEYADPVPDDIGRVMKLVLCSSWIAVSMFLCVLFIPF